MKITAAAVVVTGVMAAAWALLSGAAVQEAALPGARPVIDAAAHPSLQAAIDALPEDGGLVRIPPGTFELKQPLRVPRGDVWLQGSGTATHLKNVNAEGRPALVLGSPAYAENKRTRIWRVAVSDLRLTGNEKSGHGIEALGVNEILLHALTVSRHGGDGIRLENCYEDPRVADCLITYNKMTGLHIDAGHDIVVSANHFEENMDAVRCVDSFNLCMTGNNLDDHLGHGVVIENTYGSVVSGNMIEECKGTAIVLDRDCYGITLSANVIAHDGGGIDLRDAHGCAVSANTFTIVKANAVRIGPGSGRITVSANNFSDSYVGAESGEKRRPDDQTAAGIVLEGAGDVAVSGNLFSGLSTKAVTLVGDPPKRVLFAGNVLADVESDHAKLQAAGNLEASK